MAPRVRTVISLNKYAGNGTRFEKAALSCSLSFLLLLLSFIRLFLPHSFLLPRSKPPYRLASILSLGAEGKGDTRSVNIPRKLNYTLDFIKRNDST